MELKKNPKADLEKLRGTFTLAGLVLSLFIVYSIVNWKFYDVQAAELGQLIIDEEEEDIPQQQKSHLTTTTTIVVSPFYFIIKHRYVH